MAFQISGLTAIGFMQTTNHLLHFRPVELDIWIVTKLGCPRPPSGSDNDLKTTTGLEKG